MTLATLFAAALVVAPVVQEGDPDWYEPFDVARARHEAWSRTHVTGRLVDASGAPVVGARVSSKWELHDGVPEPKHPATTDADGRFEGTYETWYDPFGLVAYSADGRLSAAVLVDKADSHDLELVLEPVVHVRGEVVCGELGVTPEWLHGYWKLGGELTVGCESGDGTFDVPLAPADWEWEFYDDTIAMIGDALDLDGGAREVDLGVLDLPATFVRRYRGKPLPDWTVTETRGLPPGKEQPRHFRGKWILLEFWGHW